MQQYTQHCYSFYGLSALALFVTLAGPAATESDTYRLPHTLVLSQAIQPSPSQVARLPTSPLPQEQVATRPTSAVALNIYFASDSAKISPKYYNELNKFGEALLRLSVPVEISGHTDNNGPEDYNQLLSELRAESVMWYLVNHFGINPLRVSARGYGNRRPRASNDSESGRRQNRRIEVSAEDKPVEQAAVKKVDVSALIDALHAPEGADRWAAAQALGNIKAKAKAAVPALINTLSIQTGADRRAAIEALGDIGAEAKAAFPALIDALQDRVWTVYAAKALSQIAPSFQDRAESLTMADLRYVIADLEKALKVLEDVRMEFAGKEDVIRSLQRPRDALDAQLKLRVPQQLLQHKMTPSVVAFFLLRTRSQGSNPWQTQVMALGVSRSASIFL
jgi:outer membrane protein OmpA-like peptidoglycan-associated protein